MSIVYRESDRTFYLSGGGMSYVLHVTDTGELLNLWWGARVPDGAVRPDLSEYPEGASFDKERNHLPWELPTRGSGWYGTPAVSAVNAHGDDVTVLKYVSHTIAPGKPALPGLPSTYVESPEEAGSLEILMKDPLTGLNVTARYTVFEKTGALTRSLRLKNAGDGALRINALLPASVPLRGEGYEVIHLKGGWARERRPVRMPVGEGEYRIFSQRGASGHEENPFLAVVEPGTDEFSGAVRAMSFVYSGSFLAGTFSDNMFAARMYMGMEPNTFRWLLEPGEELNSPEVVLVYSDDGLNGMSRIYHTLYRTRLVRGRWRDLPRPVLVNNWEGTYFDFNEEKILSIARKAKEIGVELMVLDDGWFGKRNTDNCSLGDWVVNREKLPNGIRGLAEKVNALGLRFGLWFEPEMVSPDSDLYRAHPDWCLHVDGRERTQARQQLILDLSRREVQDYIISAVSAVLREAPVGYVKWDMNRNMTEHFSAALSPERQMETQHRYILGLYRVLEEITSAFPEVLFESCSGGGGRFDPGMLYYMPQTWTSDDTDAVERCRIQYGTSYVYPASAMGAHVSAVPNHQTGRITPLRTRGEVAMGGNFGFELDLSRLTEEETEEAKRLVKQVKQLRELTGHGEFTRLVSPFEGRYTAWQFASQDASELLLFVCQSLCMPNRPPVRIRMKGLTPGARYRDDAGETYSAEELMYLGKLLRLRRDFESAAVHLTRV